MNAVECPREQEIIDAIASGRWPNQLPDDLRAHVNACAICAEVGVVARAMHDERDAADADARVPPSGRVWWRAEMRARREAAEKAARPMAIVEIAAAASASAVGIVVAALLWPVSWIWMALFAVGSLVLIAPVAVYLVLSDK